jgi:hypothetical protein
VVRDVRHLNAWAVSSAIDLKDRKRTIVYHHTATGHVMRYSVRQALDAMDSVKNTAPYGLPYNFVVFPEYPWPVYYLNDVDQAWPHTYGWNHATAIAAWGNYSVDEPPTGLVRRMWHLADALATMWGEYIPEIQHRDVYATECPGNLLSPALRREL